MPKGAIFSSEAVEMRDPTTGAAMRQITSHKSTHHHPFYYIPAYDDAMRWLFFVSHRTGMPQLFAQRRETGHLIPLTDRDDLNEWSFHPSHDGRYLYFTTKRAAGDWTWKLSRKSNWWILRAAKKRAEWSGPAWERPRSATTIVGGQSPSAVMQLHNYWSSTLRRESVTSLVRTK